MSEVIHIEIQHTYLKPQAKTCCSKFDTNSHFITSYHSSGVVPPATERSLTLCDLLCKCIKEHIPHVRKRFARSQCVGLPAEPLAPSLPNLLSAITLDQTLMDIIIQQWGKA